MKKLLEVPFVSLVVCLWSAIGPGLSSADADLSPVERVIKIRSNAILQELESLADTFEARTFPCTDGWNMPYRLFTPEMNPGEQYPLVLYLHGGSGRGTDNVSQYSGSHRWGSRVWARTVNQADHPCFIVAPQWDGVTLDREAHTKELVDALMGQFPIDEDRLYVTGFSIGGSWTWKMTANYPGVFAAAVPTAGWGDTSNASIIVDSNVAVWVFHGEADSVVAVSYARDMVAALEAAGGNPRYTEYADSEHGYAALGAYTEPEIVPWVFSQVIPEPATLGLLGLGAVSVLTRRRR